jgi:hypothetical protein
MGLLSKAITVNPPAVRQKQVSAGIRPGQPAGAEAVQDQIRGYWRQNPSFQGIVLERPDHSGEAGDKTFFASTASAAASLGRVIRLPSKNILILFPKALDRELLIHRLVRTLRARALAGFEAGSPGEAFSRIQSL